ncbi:MAG: NAD(+) synthase [Coriobacteriia bacterium]|nr:NAD(+) synthase [Coriobacteriia bacterium]
MYIAIVQSNPTTGALRSNAEKALAVINELAALPYPPDLVVFPAYALTGANLKGLIYHDAFAAECMDVAKDFIVRAQLPTLIGTMIPRPLEDRFSFICEPEVLFCSNGKGGALGFVDVDNSWSSDRYASSIDIDLDGNVLTVILDDYPEPDDDFSHSEIVIMMLAKEYEGTSSLFTSSTQINYLRSLANQNHTWLLVANLVGSEDELVYDGASIVLDAYGSVKDSAEPFAEDTMTVNFDLSASRQTSRRSAKTTQQDSKTIKPLLPYEADWYALILSIRDYVVKNGFSDVVLGLSGGIDSALVAALAAEALGSEHVHGVLIPGPFTSDDSNSDAISLAHNLRIPTLTFSITELFSIFKESFAQAFNNEGTPIAQENLQARLRMMLLMYLANSNGWLLLNTSNKSEIAVGYFTLYGDAAGSFAPIGSLYKTDIYGLVDWRNNQQAVIPQSIVIKDPSAELQEGQRDSDSLPSYEVLDRILRLHIEDDFGIDQILETARQEPTQPQLDTELVRSVLEMVRKAEHKRRQTPLSPLLGTVDLCEERNWPITCGYSDHDRHLTPYSDIFDYLSGLYAAEDPSGFSIHEN